MNLFKSFLRMLHDHNSDVRQQRNAAVLAPLGDGDANSKHITSLMVARSETARLGRIALRRIKEDREKAQTQIELYLDDWIFHNGPIRTEAQFKNAVRDCVDRITQRRYVAQQRADEYDGMKDFPL